MTMVLLLRHALTDATGKRLSGRLPGLHLSETGRLQAERLGERLRPVPLAALYASPLERCMETAAAVAEGRPLQIVEAPDLLEVAYGTWSGRPFSQIMRTKLWTRLQQAPSAIRFPEGEALDEVQVRATRFLDGLAAAHPKKVVAVCTHADVIRLALAHYAGVHLDLFQRLIVSPASLTAILLGDRIPRIIRVNDTGTVEDLIPRRPQPRSRRAGGVAPGRATAGGGSGGTAGAGASRRTRSRPVGG
jgi:probable phosphomutase (TIGR03848 family)